MGTILGTNSLRRGTIKRDETIRSGQFSNTNQHKTRQNKTNTDARQLISRPVP